MSVLKEWFRAREMDRAVSCALSLIWYAAAYLQPAQQIRSKEDRIYPGEPSYVVNKGVLQLSFHEALIAAEKYARERVESGSAEGKPAHSF